MKNRKEKFSEKQTVMELADDGAFSIEKITVRRSSEERNMDNMKKTLAVLLPVLILCGILSGCENKSISHSEKLSIVITVSPVYDWVRNILGEKAADTDLTLLPEKGADLYGFQPTEDDILRISQCDLLIYAGGEADQWVEDALEKAGSPEIIVIRLLDVLEAPVMEGGEDEHVWLSPKNAEVLIPYLCDALIEADPKNAAVYTENAEGL